MPNYASTTDACWHRTGGLSCAALPKGRTGKVVTWTVEPHAIAGWVRQPNIGFSQVGYIPNQPKVAVVGAARPKAVFYGNNRADFSFIPGNVAPGLLFRKPDHFENYDDWPFLWGQNEGTIAGNTQYIIFGSILKDIVNKK